MSTKDNPKTSENKLKLVLNTLKPNQLGTYDYAIIVEGYEELNCFVRSLICITQSAVLSEETNKNNICHSGVDIYNVLELATKLLPYDECFFLDEVQKRDLNTI